jgi:hypothetical protein
LGFEIKHLAGYTVTVDLIATISDCLLQFGYTSAIDSWQVFQLVSDLLQLLSLTAQLNGFTRTTGFFQRAGCYCRLCLACFFRAAGAVGAAYRCCAVEPVEINDQDKNPLVDWTLAMVSTRSGETLAINVKST